MECHGVPEYVLVGGRVCVDEGLLKVVQGHGKFIPTPTHSDAIYNNQVYTDNYNILGTVFFSNVQFLISYV